VPTWNRQSKTALACALLVFSTFTVYWAVTGFEFVNFDDQVYVTENRFVQLGITSSSAAWAFTNVEAEFWQPLTWLSHMLDWQLYGPKAGGHHLTSLILHIANTLLAFLLFKRMTDALWRSAFVAGLFALHPLHVESVAWAAERKDVLSLFFGLIALWAYAAYAQPRFAKNRSSAHSGIYYCLALLFFVLSLMSKPMLVTMPFLLLLLDYWPLQRFTLNAQNSKLKTLLRLLWEKLPFLALTLAACITAYWIQASRHNVGGLGQYPLPLRLANSVMSCFLYLRKMLWPFDLAVFYPYPDRWPIGQVAAASLLLAGISFLGIQQIRQRPYLAVGWFWYLGTLVPVIGLVQISHHAMADRYTYFPLIGIFVMIAWGAAGLLARTRSGRLALTVGAAALLLLCAIATPAQVAFWRNSLTLSEHALAVTANNYLAHQNLGAAYEWQNNFDAAFAEFQTAFEIESSLRFNPDLPGIRYNLGTALARKGRLDEAKAHFLRVLQLQPNVPRVHHNLASVLALQGNLDEAIVQYEQALRLDPGYEEARANLESVRRQRAQWIAAGEHYASGDALLKEKRDAEAIREFHEALRLRPEWPELLNNVGWLLATHPNPQIRDGAQAVSLAARACDLTARTNLWLLSTLAAAYAEAGKFTEAVDTQQQVCELARQQPGHPESFQSRLELYRSGKPYHQPNAEAPKDH
jgi:tetratricopeptide (TPR) repeat protein